MSKLKALIRKKNKAGIICPDDTDHISSEDRVCDDNRFPNRVIELICEVCDENNYFLKRVLEAFIVNHVEAYEKQLN